MAYIHRTMIVPASLATLARALAVGMEPISAANMWPCGLSPTGSNPPTHYVSTGYIDDQFGAMLLDADALFAACGPAVVTLDQCTALVIQSDVSEDAPFDAFARLGLQLVQAGPT